MRPSSEDVERRCLDWKLSLLMREERFKVCLLNLEGRPSACLWMIMISLKLSAAAKSLFHSLQGSKHFWFVHLVKEVYEKAIYFSKVEVILLYEPMALDYWSCFLFLFLCFWRASWVINMRNLLPNFNTIAFLYAVLILVHTYAATYCEYLSSAGV